MEEKRFIEPQPENRHPPNYHSVVPSQQQIPPDNPPPYYSTPGPVEQTITLQPITTQRVYTMAAVVGPSPYNTVCPNCLQNIVTRLDIEISTKTHLVAGILCLVFWPCFWLPYAIDTCKNKNHYCPACNTFIGTYRD